MKTYAEWEEGQGISPVSPEAYYAEVAWNAALKQALTVTAAALASEGGDAMKALILIRTEIEGLQTGLGA